MIDKYLPIGTVLMLKEGKKRIMIIGYLPVNNIDDKQEIYDYAACLYPEGIISSDKTLLFNHEQIDKIYYLGNNDEETKNFLEQLNGISRETALKKFNDNKENNKEKKDDESKNGSPKLIIED